MVLVTPQAGLDEKAEVLALLRQGSGERPRFDPGLAGGLRAWLEDAASLVVRVRGEDSPALHLGTGQLIADEPLSAGVERVGFAGSELKVAGAAVISSLVHALFRQLVVTGTLDEPLGDALGALGAEDGTKARAVLAYVQHLDASERGLLAGELAEHAHQLRTLTPPLQPGWLPRTDERVAVPLAGGRVVLHGRFDLLIGTPSPGVASLCAVGVTAEEAWAAARRRLHVLALFETIRHGMPPFRLALLHSGDGRYGAEDVLEEHLRSVAEHVADQLAGVARAAD
ncbi:MAG TPA: hypothetical protein VGG38_10760 [Acidimicrobiales bacterium]|jgi:hypothetical protein